jgi:hypothetical protein
MKPSRLHFVIAHTFQICGVAGALAGVGLLFVSLNEAGALIPDVTIVFWSVIAAVLMAAMGWVFGVTFLWMMFGKIAARIQGWPFHVGDQVYILSGKNRNQIARIYEIWDERGQVRLELGDELKNAVEDVFCAVLVCRMKSGKSAYPTVTSR